MKRISFLALALSAVLLAPQQVSARGVPAPSFVWGTTTCAGSTLMTCVEFELLHDASTGLYYFSATYASSLSSDPGVVTDVFFRDHLGGVDFNFSNVTLVSAPPGTTWGTANPGGNAVAGAFSPVLDNGLQVGETVVFSFTSNHEITSSSMTDPGGTGAQAAIQFFGTNDCHLVLDSRDGLISGPSTGIDNCGTPTTVVPEPATMLLLGSGLAGVAVVARRRRKKDAQLG